MQRRPGDLIIYRTARQKLPILTANDTTTYIGSEESVRSLQLWHFPVPVQNVTLRLTP